MELASYVIRQRRKHKDRLAYSDKRLEDFLAAMQASPNGVVLMDADDRIEWFNQTAAEHFGLDARRDAEQQRSGQQLSGNWLDHIRAAGKVRGAGTMVPLRPPSCGPDYA